jgi:hypothetical protein
MTDHIIEVLDRVIRDPIPHACACMGPQDDGPLCPCAMRNVVLYKGRYVRLELLPLEDQDEDWSEKAINQRVTKMDPKRLP